MAGQGVRYLGWIMPMMAGMWPFLAPANSSLEHKTGISNNIQDS